MKLTSASLVELNTTVVPAVWRQLYNSIAPSGSVLADPSRVTELLTMTVWFEPALAIGSILSPPVP